MAEDGSIGEAFDRGVDFSCGVGEVLGGVVDREDVGGMDGLGDRSCCGDGFSVGGVGEVDVVEGVVAIGGMGEVWCPSGVEREEAEEACGDEGGLVDVVGFEMLDERLH